ncbi:hypothetical protein HY844_03105 [Candidatus Berkelbacteria bacterium]|nr:hypothetical protein [Candidatus Berkelbacteria bacterium]
MGKVLRSKYPQVQGFTWFNYKKETDWRINSSESAKKAFIAMVKGSSATTAPTPPQSPPTNSTSNSSNQTDNTIFSGKTEPSPNNKTESPTIPKVTATNPENNILNPVLIADLPEPENKITESIYVSRSYLDKASDPEQIALAIIGLCTLLLVILLGVGGVLHTHKHFKSRRNQQNYHKLKTQKARIQKQIDALTRKLSEIESKLEN